MEITYVLDIIRDSLVFILIFCVLLGYAMVRSRRSLVSLILGLYIALLVSLTFPYQEKMQEMTGSEGGYTFFIIGLFAVTAVLGTFLFEKLLYQDYFESAFESFPKKLVLAFLATALVMIFSYHILPLTQYVDPGGPAHTLFGHSEYFFWWLLAPLVGLFVVM